MTQLLPLTSIRPITDERNVLTEEARVYFVDLADRVPSYGEGSPEGVIDAPIGATYYDLAAASGSRHYIKINAAISGDPTKGWELA